MTTSKVPADGSVDWEHLHERIAQARARRERVLVPTEADEHALLLDRARRLARPAKGEAAVSTDDLLLFTLPGETYAVPTRAVCHVFPSAPAIPIPWAPPLFRGLVNYRGRPLLVVDIGLLLGRPTRADDADVPFVLVLSDEPDDLGLAVSSAVHLGEVPGASITRDDLPAGLADIAFVRGVSAPRRLLLDIDKLLHDPRLVLGPPTPDPSSNLLTSPDATDHR